MVGISGIELLDLLNVIQEISRLERLHPPANRVKECFNMWDQHFKICILCISDIAACVLTNKDYQAFRYVENTQRMVAF